MGNRAGKKLAKNGQKMGTRKMVPQNGTRKKSEDSKEKQLKPNKRKNGTRNATSNGYN